MTLEEIKAEMNRVKDKLDPLDLIEIGWRECLEWVLLDLLDYLEPSWHPFPVEKPPKRRSEHKRYLCKIRWSNGKIDYRTASWLVGTSTAWFSLDGFLPTVDNKPTLCDIIAWAELPKPYNKEDESK